MTDVGVWEREREGRTVRGGGAGRQLLEHLMSQVKV